MGMDWQEEYKRKLVAPEEAVKVVKSGDRVFFGQPDPLSLGLALGAYSAESLLPASGTVKKSNFQG